MQLAAHINLFNEHYLRSLRLPARMLPLVMIFDTKSSFRRDRMAARIQQHLARDHSSQPTGLPPRHINRRDIINGVLLVLGLSVFLFLPIVYLLVWG